MVVKWWQVIFTEVEPIGFVDKLDVSFENKRESRTAPQCLS